jgi:hypothetical protein
LGSFDRLNIHEPRRATLKKRRFEAALKARYHGNPRFTFLETEPLLLNEDGSIPWWDGKSTVYYLDDDHMTGAGFDRLGGILSKTMESLIGK